jgi:Carboxypeptidase regulatory-like domain
LIEIRLKAGGKAGRIEQAEDPAEGVVRGRPTLQSEKFPQHSFFRCGKIGHVHAVFGSAQRGTKGNDQDIQQFMMARVGTAWVFQGGKRFRNSEHASSSRRQTTGTLRPTSTNADLGSYMRLPCPVTSGPSGEYRIDAITPSTYTLTVTASGFNKKEVSGFAVQSSIVTSQNITLEIGTTQTTVSVEAAGAQIQTESGELSQTIATVEIAKLPINSLNPIDLVLTQPGVTSLLPTFLIMWGLDKY